MAIGTTYYGRRWLADGTYVTTKWFVIVYLPLLPIGSVRILSASHEYGSAAMSGQSLVVQKIPLDKWMVIGMYAFLVGGAVGLVAALKILSWFPWWEGF